MTKKEMLKEIESAEGVLFTRHLKNMCKEDVAEFYAVFKKLNSGDNHE